MNESKKTLAYIAVAIGLALIAYFVAPKRTTPEAFLDQGELFFPDFTDPNAAGALEVIEYDAESGTAHPFKVVNNNGNWTIPSHNDYPADGEERLAKTAAGVIGIKKDDFRSDNVAEHGALGVIDPLDQTAGLSGRGKRVTMKDVDGKILADFIIGNEVEGRPKVRFVRLPDQKRVYAARVDIDLSTRFEDWIETDLLKIGVAQINKVEIKDYSINERTRSVEQRDDLVLSLKEGKWKADKMGSGKQVDSTGMNEILKTLDELTIVGVRKKPEGLSASLTASGSQQTISPTDARSLQTKGYYFSNDGRLLSNEGELKVSTTEGVIYTLRFGEVVYGSGDAVSAGSAEGEVDKSSGENRFLMVTSEFVPSAFPEPAKPSNTDYLGKVDSLMTDADRANQQKQIAHDQWLRNVENGKKVSEESNRRFAQWYYVISSDSYEKMKLTRDKLIVSK